jgi:uncharacterized protein YceH (UPF0502 family)
MHPLESLEMVRTTVEQLMNKPQPLAKRVAPAPGSRAERYAQLSGPEPHVITEAEAGAPPTEAVATAGTTVGQRVAQLETEVASLRAAISKLAAEIGAQDPLA